MASRHRFVFAHALVDAGKSTVPAMLPVLIAAHTLAMRDTGLVVLAGAVGLAVGQAGLGPLADRARPGDMSIVGLVTAAAALGLFGLLSGVVYLSIAAAVFSLGIAAFHTDAIRIVVETAPTRAATVIGTFTFAGSAGYALGPLVVAGALAVIAPEAAPLMALLPLTAAILIARSRKPRLAQAERYNVSPQHAAAHESHWRSFSLVAALAAARSGLSTGLQSFVPIYFVVHLRLASSDGSMLLSGMLAAAGLGSLLGGAAIDRLGARSIAIGTLGLALAGLVSAVLTRHALVPGALLLVALGLDACFTATVVLANGCLPGRAGLATGLTLSIGTVTGGLTAAGLTLLAAHANADAGLYALGCLAAIGTTLALATSSRAGGPAAVYA